MKERRKLKAIMKKKVTLPSSVVEEVEVEPSSEPVPEVSQASDVELVSKEATECKECGMEFNQTDFRRTIDNCGHVKCLKCIVKSEACCATCEEKGKEENKTKPSSLSPLGPFFKVPQRPPPHACSECEERFELKWSLEVHLKDVHGIEVYHACDQCPRTFTYKEDFERHLRTHDEHPFKCSMCPVAFFRKETLVRHIKNAHKIKGSIPELATRVEEV